MSINPSTVGHNAYDLLDGSVSSFYADVDEAIVASEVVKGQYRMTINPAYNSPNPVSATSFTTVGLTQSGPMVVDLDNSYITTTAEITINLTFDYSGAEGMKFRKGDNVLFFGWKSSIEAIERYDILVNNTPIYTQSFCGEESFIQNMVRNDLVKNTSPYTYSPWENVAAMSPNVAGVYVKLPQDPDAAHPITQLKVYIPLKIPLDNFLILKNLKYLLSWMGKWEIRLFFSAQNMVICPLRAAAVQAELNRAVVTADTTGGDWFRFSQMNDSFRLCIGSATLGGEALAGLVKCTCTCAEMVLQDVEMNTASFQIRGDILEMLKAKYLSDRPLTFPVSTLAISRFTGAPYTAKTIPSGSEDVNLSIVLCQAINNCDTMFVLPFEKAIHHTVCKNPYVRNLQLHAGEYGAYPTQPFDTFAEFKKDNIRFVNYIADALNVNASELCSFSKSVARNFHHQAILQNETGSEVLFYSNLDADDTDFFIAFPFSTDDDFQGGLSSPASNINFKLTGAIHNISGEDRSNQTPWVAAFLIDGVIMIRPDPGSDAAKVIWSDRTVC